MTPNNLPVPFPCLRAAINNKGPDRKKFSGKYNVCPASRKDLKETSTQPARGAVKPIKGIATYRPGLALGLWLSVRILISGVPERRMSRLS
ncbi:MAG: hypothetical protein WCA89_18805 [Terracidiphilus sp.]|jgi:hypothetical protein